MCLAFRMGWCSGTRIFDNTADALFRVKLSDDERSKVLTTLIDALWEMDWDCEEDSRYWHHETVGVLLGNDGDDEDEEDEE